jgi:hypothetical protein
LVGINGTFDSNNFPGKIFGTATDSSGSGVQKVEFKLRRDFDALYWNGTNWLGVETWLLATGTTNWEYPINKSNFVSGSYSVYSRATDNSQNLETTLGYQYFIFNTGEGNPCNYQAYGDSQCDANNGIYCINNSCASYSGSITPYCTDTDDQNAFRKGIVSYRYRYSNGQIMDGNISDECSFAGSPRTACEPNSSCQVQEASCQHPLPSVGMNYDLNLLNCANGCSNGACIQWGVDQNLNQNVLDVNSIHSVSDSELLSYISKWSRQELHSNPVENDWAIQQIIAIWKDS